MNHIWPRQANATDAGDLAKWLEGTDVEPEIFSYGSTHALVAESAVRKVAIMPVQLVAMLETLAKNPDASKLEIAEALKTLLKTVNYEAEKRGIGEVYFLTREETIGPYAAAHAFEEVKDVKVYRMKTKKGPK